MSKDFVECLTSFHDRNVKIVYLLSVGLLLCISCPDSLGFVLPKYRSVPKREVCVVVLHVVVGPSSGLETTGP